MKNPAMKNSLSAALFACGVALLPTAGWTHHGWAWTSGGDIELVGVIREARLGNPHGILSVDVEGTLWTVEVGQPWRNERAGLEPGDLAAGVEIRVIGEPSADPSERRLKAERLYRNGEEHVLYPDR